MAKEEQINFRIDPELKKRLKDFTKDQNYDDMTSVIIEAIIEKIDPEYAEREFKKRFLKYLDDPDILNKLHSR